MPQYQESPIGCTHAPSLVAAFHQFEFSRSEASLCDSSTNKNAAIINRGASSR
jgi:hypothetical protein